MWRGSRLQPDPRVQTLAPGLNSHPGVLAVRKEEGSLLRGGVHPIVVREFRKRKKLRPVVLLIVTVDAKVLLECLVSTFGLTVTFRMIPRREVQLHVERFIQRAEEV